MQITFKTEDGKYDLKTEQRKQRDSIVELQAGV